MKNERTQEGELDGDDNTIPGLILANLPASPSGID